MNGGCCYGSTRGGLGMRHGHCVILFNIVLINKLYCLRWCAMLLNVNFILILFTLKISELFGLCKDI